MSGETTPDTEPAANRVVPVVAVVVGCGLIAYALSGMLGDLGTTAKRVDWVRWIVGLDIVHDALVAPIVVLIGWFVVRRVHAVIQAPLAFALGASGVMLFIAWHPLHQSGARAGNSSIQPLNYATATLTVLLVVWVLAALWALVRFRAASQR